MRTWGSYLERPIDGYSNDALLAEYRDFVRFGKAALMDHLGMRVPSGDLPTWIDEDDAPLTPGSTSLLFLVCDIDPNAVQNYDLQQQNMIFYDQGYQNGQLVLSWGDNVIIRNYKKFLNRFRSVGMRAMIRSNSWDDKVEHLVVDLWATPANGEPHQVFIIKPSDLFLGSQEVKNILMRALSCGMPSIIVCSLNRPVSTASASTKTNRACQLLV
jgi:hypothetical protein